MINSKSLHYEFEAVPAPKNSFWEKRDNCWEVCHIVSGTGLLSTGETNVKIYPGIVFLIPPGIPINLNLEENSPDNDGHKICRVHIIFHDNMLDKFVTILPKLKEPIEYLRKRDTIALYTPEDTNLIAKTIWKMKDLQEDERASALLKLILLLTKGNGKTDHEPSIKSQKAQKNLELVNLYIMHHANRKIKLEDVARHVNMNRFTFCTFFRKNTGKTFFSYLEEYRIHLACKMLEEEESSISDICYKAGFNDVPHFNRTFKRIMGITPKEYRKRK